MNDRGVRRARRGAAALVVVALAFLSATLVASGSAAAAQPGAVQISLGDRPFTDQPAGSLLAGAGLAPGGGVSGLMGIRNGMDGAADLRLQFSSVHDDDAGCTGAEQAVDRTCGTGQGDLGSALRVSIATASRRDGTVGAGVVGDRP